MCGKTQIAKELSKRLNIPYFKSSNEHSSFLASRASKSELFLNQLLYADPRAFDLVKQTGQSVVMDRGFPCEWVYSTVFKRKTDKEFILHMDSLWASLGAKIIFCWRSSYDGIVDDLDPTLSGYLLQDIHDEYVNFLKLTKCEVIQLCVDDEDLEREINDLMCFLNITNKGDSK